MKLHNLAIDRAQAFAIRSRLEAQFGVGTLYVEYNKHNKGIVRPTPWASGKNRIRKAIADEVSKVGAN